MYYMYANVNQYYHKSCIGNYILVGIDTNRKSVAQYSNIHNYYLCLYT